MTRREQVSRIGFGAFSDHQQIFYSRPNRHLVWYYNETWHFLTGFDALRSKAGHGADIMGERDASFFGRPCENDRVVFRAKANILD
jgi:hypothetical protein